MGTCCSKRDRRSDSTVHAGAVLHPSLENWKIHNRPPLSELDVAGNGVDRSIPVMWAKPNIKAPLSFPSVHYNISSNLLCDSAHSSSQSLGAHAKPQPQRSLNTSKLPNEDGLLGLANHYRGHAPSAHHNSPTHEPDSEMLPAFSFATQPYIEPDFFNNTAFAFHPATQSARLSSITIDSTDCIQLQVRHKHMFPEEFQALHASLVCSTDSTQAPLMKRSRSDGKLPEAKQEEAGQAHMQHHRRSFHATTGVHDMHDQMRGGSTWFSKASKIVKGASLSEPTAQANLITDMDDDYIDDDDNDNFLDINVGVSIDHLNVCRTLHAEQAKEGDLEDIKHCISLQVSSDSKTLSMEAALKDGCVRATSQGTNIIADDKVLVGTSVQDFELKQSMSQESFRFTWDEDFEWHERSEAIQADCEDDKVKMKQQQLSVVSTGDAILLSGSDTDEFHIIPSRYVPHPRSPPMSPRVNLSPLKLMDTYDQSPENTSLCVEDILHLLESDDMNEDELLSLLINTKSSPSQSPSESISMSMSSSSSVLTSSSTSSLASSSSSSSSSSPRPWFPRPSSASPGSSSQSLLSSMPLLLPFSTRSSPSPLPYSLSQHPSTQRMSPHSSFEFKVKSCNSAASTPMFSPIRSTTKRNIAHLKPTALTTEEIAEIWGVFEQRQTLVTQH